MRRLFSALFVLYPYLTIHMRELGINVEETAIMSAVTPVVSIVMPPLAGMLADKIGNFRVSYFVFSTCYFNSCNVIQLHDYFFSNTNILMFNSDGRVDISNYLVCLM